MAERTDVTSVIADSLRIGYVAIKLFYADSLSKYVLSVTEEPYKTPYYAALLVLLHQPVGETMDDSHAASDGLPIGRAILEDFWKGFQTFLDNQAWRELRLCVSTIITMT